jgi:hypothetical protein
MSEQQILSRFETNFTNVYNNLKNTMTSIQEARGAADALPFIQQGDSILRQGEQLFKQLDVDKRHMDNAAKGSIDRKKKTLLRDWESTKAQYTQLKAKYSVTQLSASQQAELRDQRQKLLVARDIQQDTTQSLNNTETTIQQTILVGRDTNLKLDQQTEQLNRMNQSVEDTNTSLDNSKNLLLRMKRRILTNKLAQVLIIVFELIILACVCFIKYYA